MNTNMTGFKCSFKNICILMLWTRVASVFDGLTSRYAWFREANLFGSVFLSCGDI